MSDLRVQSSRRHFVSRGASLLAALAAASLTGCDREGSSIGRLEAVWGRRGISNGRLQKPRAIAIDSADRLYIVDMTARIQVFSSDARFLLGWQTPVHVNGRPTGLSIDPAGRVIVADTHYYRVLVYSPDGELLQTVGGVQGHAHGEFGFVTDAVVDADGNFYVGEYGEYDRIQKFDAEGRFLLQWGGHGGQLGQFIRPQSLVLDGQRQLWVADACNHRIQIFDLDGRLVAHWGRQGRALGELSYPYDLAFDADGHVLVCEYGNHRVQKFTRDGQSLGAWGREGRQEGELFNPWGIVIDARGRAHVLDTNNHRVQRVVM